MARIVLLVTDSGPNKADVVAAIRRESGLGVSEIVHRVRDGIPIADARLFRRDHRSVSAMLIALATGLPRIGARVELFEVPDSYVFSIDTSGAFRISSEVLVNIVAEHDREVGRQKEIAFDDEERNR